MDVTRTQRNRSLVSPSASGSHANGAGRVSTHRFIATLLAVCFAWSQASLLAQDEGDSPDDASRLAAAFESTQGEVTLESLTHVVDVCEEVLAASPAEADAKYAKQLCSWALVERCQFQLEVEVSRDEIIPAVDRALELQPDSAKALELKAKEKGVELLLAISMQHYVALIKPSRSSPSRPALGSIVPRSSTKLPNTSWPSTTTHKSLL